MAVITWEQINARCGDDDNVTITIRELSDGNPTGKEYSARFHNDRTVDEFKADLKKQILTDRAKTTKADIFSERLDLSEFENYINQ